MKSPQTDSGLLDALTAWIAANQKDITKASALKTASSLRGALAAMVANPKNG